MRRCYGSTRKIWGISRGKRNLFNRSHRRDCRGWSIKNLFNLKNLLILKLEFKDMGKIGNSRLMMFKRKKKRLKKSRLRRRNSKMKYLTLECKRKKRKISKTTSKMKGKKNRRKILRKNLRKQKKWNTKSLWLNSKRLNSQSKSKRWNNLRKKSKNLKRKRNQRDNPKRKVLLNYQNSPQKWPKQ